MFKRILAFIMCMVMALGMIGCGKKGTLIDVVEKGDTRSDNAPITLSLYVPSLSTLKEETRLAVEKALNAISVKKYNTTLQFFAYPEEVYVPIVLSKIQTEMNSYVTYLWGQDEETRDIESTVDYSQYGAVNFIDMTSYPELAGVGIDIFVSFTPGQDSIIRQETIPDPANPEKTIPNPHYNGYMADNMFLTMYYERVLAPISPRLINEYAVLKSKSYTEFFDAVSMPDMDAENVELAKPYAYAMPNNYLFGSYQYLILNKDVVSEIHSVDYSGLSGNTVKLEQLKKDLTALKNKGSSEKVNNVKNVFVEFDSYEEYEAFDESFAIAMIKGDRALPEVIANPNYEIVKFSTSEYNKAEFATSMYCITRAYRKELESDNIDEDDRIMRCLDILLLIQNDVDFRNTLQYGVKGEHYNISRDGIVYTSSNDYIMDPATTGNMFLLYPSDRMSPSMRKMAENNWRLAKAQNKEILDSKPAN